MEVKINKEIMNYKESIYFGLSLRQFIFSLIACIIAVLLYFLFFQVLSLEVLSWVCILGAAPFAAFGFIKYNGMKLEEFVLSYIKTELLMSKKLVFKPVNFYEELINCKGDVINENSKKNVKNR